MPTTINEKEIEDEENWRNEHGEPDIAFLKSLVADGSPEGLEKLRSIADDVDAEYASDTPSDEIIQRILLAVQQNNGAGPRATT